MEDNTKCEQLHFLSSMKQIKHYLVLIAFGVPLTFLGLNFYVWPTKWNEVYSNPIQLFWCSIVPIAVFLLIFTEAYGATIKSCRHYHGVTLLLYESIWLLSMLVYVHSLMHLTPSEKWTFGKYPLVEWSYFLPIGFILCSHWMKNTFVHISLWRCKISTKVPVHTQYDLNVDSLWLLERILIMLLLLSFLTLSTYSLRSLFNHDLNFSPVGTFESFGAFLFPLLYTQSIFASKCSITSQSFIKANKRGLGKFFKYDCMLIIAVISMKALYLMKENELNYPDSILFWMCCMSIGRQWFLDMEICPQKYENYFKAKRNIVSTIECKSD